MVPIPLLSLPLRILSENTQKAGTELKDPQMLLQTASYILNLLCAFVVVVEKEGLELSSQGHKGCISCLPTYTENTNKENQSELNVLRVTWEYN